MWWLSYVLWAVAVLLLAAAAMQYVNGKQAMFVKRRADAYAGAVILAGVAAMLVVAGVQVG